MTDLTRDPSIGPHLAAGDLERLAQHRLREGSQTTKVEAEPAPALELILDLRRQVRGRVDANELPSDILAEPVFELGGRLAAHRRRDAEPIPRHVDRPQHRIEDRVRIGHTRLREHALGKARGRLHIAQPLQVNHHRRHGSLLSRFSALDARLP